MPLLRNETLPLRTEADVVLARQAVRRMAAELRFSLVEQTKIVTAASELARNTLIHGGGGSMQAQIHEEGSRRALRLIFLDEGPGITNLEQALQDGYSTAGGLGMGLGGARRLVDDFEIDSRPGEGTRVTITRWT